MEAIVVTRFVKTNAGAVLAVVTAIAGSAPVVCQADALTPIQMRVNYSDLNINTAEGASRLYSRIERTAYYACGTSTSDMEAIMDAQGPCVKTAIAHAVRDLHSSKLTEVFIKRNGAEIARTYGIELGTRTALK